MDHESPLKAWVRKHSPLKSRFATNKPLPPSPPREDSSTKQKAADWTSAQPVVKGPSKFLSFLKKTPQPQSQPISATEESTSPKRKRGTFASLTSRESREGLYRSPIRKSLRRRTSAVDLNKLSQKVSNLEAQLKEARQELDTVVGTVRAGSETQSAKIDREIMARQQNLTAGGRYSGLVENLLEQKSSPYKQQSLSSSANLPRAYAEYLAVEDALEAEGRFVDTTPRQAKRKRQTNSEQWQSNDSELRSPESQADRSQYSERPPTRRKSDHTKQLPVAPSARKGSESDGDREPRTPTSRHPISVRSADLTKKRPHFPPPRLDSLPAVTRPSVRQPHKPALEEPTLLSSQTGVLYEISDREYTSSGSSSPYTPPALLQENIDPVLSSSSPFHESPTPRIMSPASSTNGVSGKKTVISSPQLVTLTPLKRHVTVPAKLSTVDEEFEWNDEEIF